MTIIKTADLTTPALDWAVAKCMWPDAIGNTIPWHKDGSDYSPTTNWAHGGPIIEREGMHVDCLRQGKNPVWEAWPYASGTKDIQQGPSPLIAAMRCYVASKLGDVVDVPNELI